MTQTEVATYTVYSTNGATVYFDGGGAGFSSSHNSGGNGYQGICIIKFVK